jgi:hypothetical protein
VPTNSFCIQPQSSYFSIHPDIINKEVDIALIGEKSAIMITISIISYSKKKILAAAKDVNHVSKKALATEMDTRLSKLKFVKSVYLKKINADRGYTYNIKVQEKYLGIYPRCKKLEIYKDNVARLEILFFYKDNQQNVIDAEIEKTWGMLRFKS